MAVQLLAGLTEKQTLGGLKSLTETWQHIADNGYDGYAVSKDLLHFFSYTAKFFALQRFKKWSNTFEGSHVEGWGLGQLLRRHLWASKHY